ncbi:hypothetical protein [Bacillus sp. REN10]|uniref:hypothetical protein n=1 Tax=Bacillus sp. REN10 TaxID=2782541 RepID=UPI00193BB264|nr:hypothetical protein [Bacillus sp. REN10]
MKQLVTVVKDNVGEPLSLVFDVVLDFVPYLNSFNNMRKINRAERRIKEHKEQFIRIQQLFNSELVSQEFIQERISPIILSDLIEEHEDAKINYILNGFENVFINQNQNESLIINYYDTLRNLRYEDIRKLYFYAAITDDPFRKIEKGSPEEGLSQQIFTKLERLYLVKAFNSYDALEKGAATLSEEDRKVELTTYGKDFISYISKEFDLDKYNEKITRYEIKEEDKVNRDRPVPAKFS